jgi:hypothetical protein
MSLHDYIDQSSSQKQQTTSLRTYVRNIPSQQLQPYLDSRPVLTKYSILPIIDHRKQIDTPLMQQSTYTPETVFNPGNDGGPWSGYATNINHETELRNQIFALQGCSQAVYVPSSNSSLYSVKWQNSSQNKQPFAGLFETQQLPPTNPNKYPDKIGYGLFNNATRQQTKNLTKSTKSK